jgi:hypothetical protein
MRGVEMRGVETRGEEMRGEEMRGVEMRGEERRGGLRRGEPGPSVVAGQYANGTLRQKLLFSKTGAWSVSTFTSVF